LAELQSRISQTEAARQHYAQMLEIRTRLAQQFSNSEAAQRDLAGAYQKLLDFSLQLNDQKDAEKYRKLSDDVLVKISRMAPAPPQASLPPATKPVEQSVESPTEPRANVSSADDD
jgi:hypothetical protein